jgi:hypothetical protein
MGSTPLIKDKSHDPFIIYGGLYSRSVVEAVLQDTPTDDSSLLIISEYVKRISHRCPSEEFLRQSIASLLLRDIKTELPPNSQGDIFYDNVVIETKNEVNSLDLDVIRGSLKLRSGRYETAEEELFRYLEKYSERLTTGVLTNGRSFRFYNCNNLPNYIEFDIFDIVASGSKKHANLFYLLLRNNDARQEVFLKSAAIRDSQIEANLVERIRVFLMNSEGSKYEKVRLAVFFLALRYLEDISVLPIASEEYRKTSPSKSSSFSAANLRKVVQDFYSGRWFKGQKQETFSEDDIKGINESLRSDRNCDALKSMLLQDDGSPIDLSDIYIDHLGNIYQSHIHNHSEGAYYTPHSVGRKISEYLRDLNRSTRNKFGEDDEAIIIDPACGSGQLLRTIVPFSHYFFEMQDQSIPKNSLRRKMIGKLAGIDKDEGSVFICKVGMGLMGAEAAFGLSTPHSILVEDTLESFRDSRKNFGSIKRDKIFAIVANPPWESLEFNVSNLYRRKTGQSLPKKAPGNNESPERLAEKKQQIKEFEKWQSANSSLISKEQQRIEELQTLCDEVSREHSDHFKGKKNLALYFMFAINKLLEASDGCYVVVMPDRFFVGDDCPLRDKIISEIEGYVPFQNCGRIFEGVDNGTRFGIVFGRKSSNKRKLKISIPVLDNGIPTEFLDAEVDKIDLAVGSTETMSATEKKYLLPFFTSDRDIVLLNSWIAHREPLFTWSQGKVNLGGRGKNPALGKVGAEGKYSYAVVKSSSRQKTSSENLEGALSVQFGASVEKLPAPLKAHYKARKVIVPNVKRNGIRKVIAGVAEDCLVEHDYNFNDQLSEKDLVWVCSLSYNHLVSILAGSYHINTSLQNHLGKVAVKKCEKSFIRTEVELLKSLSISEADAVELIAVHLLQGYPKEFVFYCYSVLRTLYPAAFERIPSSMHLIETDAEEIVKDMSKDPVEVANVAEVRAVLAACVINRLRDSSMLGRTKLEKSIYLLEATGCVSLGGKYARKAAGPLDSKALYGRKDGIESLAKKLRFFDSKEQLFKKDMKRVVYSPLEELDAAESKFKDMVKNSVVDLKKFNDVIRILKPLNATQSEIVATIFAAWNDLLLDGVEPTEKLIISEVRNNWHEAKKRFSEFRLLNAIRWMKKHRFVPRGIGPRTRVG